MWRILFIMGVITACSNQHALKVYEAENFNFSLKVDSGTKVCPIKSWDNIHGFYFLLGDQIRDCSQDVKPQSRYISVLADYNSGNADNLMDYVKGLCVEEEIQIYKYKNIKGIKCSKEDGDSERQSFYFVSEKNQSQILRETDVVFDVSLASDRKNFLNDESIWKATISSIEVDKSIHSE